MRICHINTNYELGGAETVMGQIHRGAIAVGVQSRMAIAHMGKRKVCGEPIIRLYPAPLEYLRYTRLRRWTETIAPHDTVTDHYFRGLGHRHFDVFHVHSFTGYAAIDSFAELARNHPTVWTLHCYLGEIPPDVAHDSPLAAAYTLAPQFLRVLRDRAEAAAFAGELQPLLRAPLHVTVPAIYAYRQLKRLSPALRWQLHHVPNGVAPALFARPPGPDQNKKLRKELGLTGDSTVVVVINRNFRITDKGFPLILEALAKTPDPGKVEIVLIGENAVWAAEHIPAAWRPKVVGFEANRRRVGNWLQVADIFLFASRRENFPCVTLEAMAAQCCVVATPTDGVCEQISDGTDGLLAAGVNGADLAVKFAEALRSPALRTRLGQQAQKRVQNDFSETRMVSSYMSIYEALTKRSEWGCPAGFRKGDL